MNAMMLAAAAALIAVTTPAHAQGQHVTALCSTDQSWCELAAREYQAQTGVRVLQVRKATGPVACRGGQSENRPVVGRDG
jgi:iron(III) transport system substrate-binding protein